MAAWQIHTLDGLFQIRAEVECAAAYAVLHSDGTLQPVGVRLLATGKAEQL